MPSLKKDKPSRKESTIQIAYCNKFASIWEYNRALCSGTIDFIPVIGTICPLCGAEDCYRKIMPYYRWVIDILHQYRKEKVGIARFQCTTLRRTFSLLPVQLAPYHHYTIASMVFALMLAIKNNCSLFRVAEQDLDTDSRANGFLLTNWLGILLIGFRRAHHWLASRFDLSEVRCEQRSGTEHLKSELLLYLRALRPKVSLGYEARIEVVILVYAECGNQFLFGIPSQDRQSSA